MLVYRQTDRQTDSQTDRQTDMLIKIPHSYHNNALLCQRHTITATSIISDFSRWKMCLGVGWSTIGFLLLLILGKNLWECDTWSSCVKCPSCHLTNTVKALKDTLTDNQNLGKITYWSHHFFIYTRFWQEDHCCKKHCCPYVTSPMSVSTSQL